MDTENKNTGDKKTQQILIVLSVLILLVLVFISGAVFATGTERAGVLSGKYEEITLEDLEEKVDPEEILEVRDTDVVRGSADILLIEYSDLDCPFCQRFHATVQELVDSGRIEWVYRHWPLPTHPNADEGAVLAECIRTHLGGEAFLTFIDEVFTVGVGSVEGYKNLAEAYELTRTQIEACLMEDSEQQRLVQQHLEEGAGSGIRGTPGSFLVDKRTSKYIFIPGAFPKEELERILDQI